MDQKYKNDDQLQRILFTILNILKQSDTLEEAIAKVEAMLELQV